MKIGIIIYSQTGNTLQVAEKAQKQLEDKGHQVDMLRLEPVGEVEPGKPVQVKPLPDVSDYDGYIFAAPVQAFSLCVPMKTAMKVLPSLDGKPTAGLITRQLIKPWLGKNQAVRFMKNQLEQKGAKLLDIAVVSWKDEKQRNEHIASAVEQLGNAF